MRESVRVVACLLMKDNDVLLARRSTGEEPVLGKWEFPGGKVKPEEDEKKAIEREIKEELELDIKALDFIVNNICSYPNKTIDLRLYKCKYLSGEVKLHDHFEYRWVNKKKLLDYDLAPADIPLAKYIKENNI